MLHLFSPFYRVYTRLFWRKLFSVSNAGTEKHDTPSSDEDEIEPLSSIKPPPEGTVGGNTKVSEMDSTEDDDDIVVSNESPVLHKIETKNKPNKSKQSAKMKKCSWKTF